MNAFFIGRFQPFHNGHLQVLKHVSQEYDEVIIGIGSSQYVNTVENPFSAEERGQMIHQALKESGVGNYRVVLIPDIHDPPHWADHVLSIVSDFEVVLSNNPLTKQLFAEKGYMVKETPVFKRTLFSGKEIRRRIAADASWEQLVPKPVVAIIKNVDGVRRIQQLMRC